MQTMERAAATVLGEPARIDRLRHACRPPPADAIRDVAIAHC